MSNRPGFCVKSNVTSVTRQGVPLNPKANAKISFSSMPHISTGPDIYQKSNFLWANGTGSPFAATGAAASSLALFSTVEHKNQTATTAGPDHPSSPRPTPRNRSNLNASGGTCPWTHCQRHSAPFFQLAKHGPGPFVRGLFMVDGVSILMPFGFIFCPLVP